ncbi:hypothetical protein HAX54_009132 [Datura stramonium]|uniref:peptidylprolyl isomerase n=1 Tax=Datura stramonium TaxID=4076 RepID=A0ABS8TEG4_DATST|nr:hypothetical protein [Datura stramonium]
MEERKGDSTIRKTQTTASTSSQGLLMKGKRPRREKKAAAKLKKKKIYRDVEVIKEGENDTTATTATSSSSIRRPYDLDKYFVGELGLALTAIITNHSNPVQLALQQYKLVSQSLNIRKTYANQILEAKEELSELEEQKIARSYFDTKIQHARLVSHAYNASHGFVDGSATDCVLMEDTPKAMNESNSTIGSQKPISGKPSNTSPKSVSEMYHSQEKKKKKKRKFKNQENHCSNTSPNSVSEMCHSLERKKKKKRKIKNQENHCDSSIPSQLEMENRSAVASSKEKKINESAISSQTRTLPDGMTVEVLVKGKPDGKVASLGKQVKVYYIAKLRDTGPIVCSNIDDSAPHKFCLGDEKIVKGLNIGLEGMHVGEKRRLTIPASMGPHCKDKPSILPDSWLQYDVELVDICE